MTTEPTPTKPTQPNSIRFALAWSREESLIVFYFARQNLFERSTFGDMLERSENRAYDSEGRRVKLAQRSWNWQPDKLPPPVLVHDQRCGEPGYEVDDQDLFRFGKVSRRMLLLERSNPGAKRALEAYYGDRGSRWAAFSSDHVDEHGHMVRGAGPGAIAALYILTDSGQKFLERERKKSEKRTGKEAEHLTDDALLANTFAIDAAQPEMDRRAHLNRVRDEAEKQLMLARRAWEATAPPRKARAA